MREKDENKVRNFLKSDNQDFLRSCEEMKLSPSRRQASKWLMKKGSAFKHHKGQV